METISFASAGNTDDKSWKFDYNGDGSDYSTPAHTIKPGTRIYFENKAKQKGYSATYLVFSDTQHKAGKYTGVWSPDNLSGFGEK